MVKTLSTAALTLTLGACAPSALLVGVQHDSHITQHAPMTRPATSYGANAVTLSARWDSGPVRFELTEGYSLRGHDGCAVCPRELFQARVEYQIWAKP